MIKIFVLVNQCILWIYKKKKLKKNFKNPWKKGYLTIKEAKIRLSKA